jgi:Protein of unknown function (DUF2934)
MAAISAKIRILERERLDVTLNPSTRTFSMAETIKARKTPAKPRKTAVKAKPNGTEATETKPVTVSHEEISKLAHRYWIEGGHREGHQHEDWARAERELRGRAS